VAVKILKVYIIKYIVLSTYREDSRAEEDIWSEERRGDGRMEKVA
jgi:hypothetical protein